MEDEKTKEQIRLEHTQMLEWTSDARGQTNDRTHSDARVNLRC